MSIDIVIGCLLLAGSIATVIGLALWSRRTIERIARNGCRTARQTLKELNGGR